MAAVCSAGCGQAVADGSDSEDGPTDADDGGDGSDNPALDAAERAIVARSFHLGPQTGCAVDTEGSTWCWGNMDFGSVQVFPTQNGARRLDAPAFARVHCDTLSLIGQEEGGSLVRFDRDELERSTVLESSVSSFSQRCAVHADEGVVCWGGYDLGNLLLGGTFEEPVGFDLPPVASIYGDLSTACTIGVAGEVHCWGDVGWLSEEVDEGRTATPFRLPGIERATHLALGGPLCVVQDGRPRCWTESFSPWPGHVEGAELVGFERVSQIAVSSRAVCALDDEGVVRCAGANQWGQLGDGTRDDRDEPRVVALPRIVELQGSTANAFCALSEAGHVYCWGHALLTRAGSPRGDGDALTPVVIERFVDD